MRAGSSPATITTQAYQGRLNDRPLNQPKGQTLIPASVAQLDRAAIFYIDASDQPPTDVMIQKATDHARMRGLLGQSPFWRMPEKQVPRNGLLSLLDPSMGGLLDY